jgi:hypothetical protein
MKMTATSIMTAKTPAAGTDLLQIVHINEEIKRVVGVSVKINIMALNAIFLAKRAGTAALGFGVLSNELRVFSQDLRTCMESLNGLIHACVNQVSIGLKGIRTGRLLSEAARLAPLQPAVARILQDHKREIEQRDQQLTILRRQLKRALEDVFPDGRVGWRAGQVGEDRSGLWTELSPLPLAQVSGEFDGVVEEIRRSLESLRRSAFFTLAIENNRFSGGDA